MSEYIVEKDTKHEDRRKKVDEMHKLFESAKQSLDAIISMLDEILTKEEDILRRENDQYSVGCTRNLSLENQEFLRRGNTKLEP